MREVWQTRGHGRSHDRSRCVCSMRLDARSRRRPQLAVRLLEASSGACANMTFHPIRLSGVPERSVERSGTPKLPQGSRHRENCILSLRMKPCEGQSCRTAGGTARQEDQRPEKWLAIAPRSRTILPKALRWSPGKGKTGNAGLVVAGVLLPKEVRRPKGDVNGKCAGRQRA